MQKVVGSSPIIRSHESPARRGFLLPLSEMQGQFVATAHRCPFDRPIERFSVRFRHPLTPLGALRIDAEGEAGVLVAELIGGEAHIVTAGAAETCERPSEPVERQRADRGDTGLL